MHCGLVHPNVLQCGAKYCFAVLSVVLRAGGNEKNSKRRRAKRGRSENIKIRYLASVKEVAVTV